MEPEITHARRTRGMKIAKLLQELPSLMNPGEVPFLIGYTDTWMPAMDGYILTTHRLIGVMGKTVANATSWSEIAGLQQNPGKKGILVDLHAGTQLKIHRLPPPDHAALQAALEIFPHQGPGSDAWNWWQLRRRELDPAMTPAVTIPSPAGRIAAPSAHGNNAAITPFTSSVDSATGSSPFDAAGASAPTASRGQSTPSWPAAAVPLESPDATTSSTVQAYCLDEESPWLVIHTIEGATLAAFDDRLLILKKTGFSCRIAGSGNGDWSTLFYFYDITDIDYRHEIHILTAGFQGANPGQNPAQYPESPYASPMNPFTMSNTVPLRHDELALCLPHLEELERKIFEVVPQGDKDGEASPAPAPGDIANQVERLVALQEKGSLSDDHFAAALAKVLDG